MIVQVLLECEECGWMGIETDCPRSMRGIHGAMEDGELCILCPKCGSESLTELMGMSSFEVEPKFIL